MVVHKLWIMHWHFRCHLLMDILYVSFQIITSRKGHVTDWTLRHLFRSVSYWEMNLFVKFSAIYIFSPLVLLILTLTLIHFSFPLPLILLLLLLLLNFPPLPFPHFSSTPTPPPSDITTNHFLCSYSLLLGCINNTPFLCNHLI